MNASSMGKMMDHEAAKLQALELEKTIGSILSGCHPGAIGAALSVLTIAWLKGHHPDLQRDLLTMHMAAVAREID